MEIDSRRVDSIDIVMYIWLELVTAFQDEQRL